MCFALLCAVLWAKPIAALQEPPAESFQIEDLPRRRGPFELAGQQFTVLLRMKWISGQSSVVDPDLIETLASVEMLGPDGSIHFEQTFPIPEISGRSFVETLHAAVQRLEGSQGKGLLLTYGYLPSTPLGGLSWQVFGVRGGRLLSFGKPLFVEGDLVNSREGGIAVETSQEPGRDGDMLHFRVWTGNFFVVVPLRIDWLQGTLAPAWQCQKMTAKGPQPICQLRVEADRTLAQEDMTFVRLHPGAEEGFGTPAHVVVRQDSQVEFLAVETEVIWAEDENGVALTVSDDPWLKVRIDGKEGWIHTQEDFQAIGLPQAG